VKESYPHFLVTDGYFFVEANFTKEAFEEYRGKFGKDVKVTDLANRVIIIHQWMLDLQLSNDALTQ
jgi:Telomere-binding protein beta subunit (TEBP beta)